MTIFFGGRCKVMKLAMGLCALLVTGSSYTIGQELKEFNADYLDSPAGGPELDEAAAAIVGRTNALRKEKQLEPLKADKKLTRAAQYFAAYLARKDELAHDADGNRPAERVSLFGYDYCIVGENIAYQAKSSGFSTPELSRLFFEGWKTSPRHLENMLDPDVIETGVAIAHDPKSDRFYAVQEFGRPRSAAIHFEVTNNTRDTLQYHVSPIGREKAEPKSFELPPRTTMSHDRCRPAKLDWGWTEKDDNVKAAHRRTYVVTKSNGDYKVTEQEANEPAREKN